MTTMMGPRRRAREVALQIVHQMDAGGIEDAGEAIARYFTHFAIEGGAAGADGDATAEGDASEALGAGRPPEAGQGAARLDRGLVDELVRGVAAHRAELDQRLVELSRNWRLERMAVVERNIIRLALYELVHCPTVPASVVINEAIELAKRFGTAEGAAFVNGLLDRAASEIGHSRQG